LIQDIEKNENANSKIGLLVQDDQMLYTRVTQAVRTAPRPETEWQSRHQRCRLNRRCRKIVDANWNKLTSNARKELSQETLEILSACPGL
jgi:uncharacterized protein involved in type VI secretion and phage assembly